MTYILLPVHNRKEITRRFINCLCAQTNSNYHLILIDDGSTDGTAEMVRGLIDASQLTVIRGNGNLWWAGSLQQGINWLNKNTSDDVPVLIINDDVSFAEDFLDVGLEVLNRNSNTLLLAKLVEPKTGDIQQSGVNADLSRFTFQIAENTECINCLSTRGLFLRLENINEIGSFYPKILPHYLSDYEFTIRAHRKGFSLYTSDEFYLTADEEQTGLHSLDEDNLLVFLKKYFSRRSAPNPIYRTVFIILACPAKYIPMLVVKTWLHTGFFTYQASGASYKAGI